MSSQRPIRTLTIDVGKPLRSIYRLTAIPISTFYRITKLNTVFLFSPVKMAGPRRSEENVGLLSNNDLYDMESDSESYPTPEEHHPLPSGPTKEALPVEQFAQKYARRVHRYTTLSLVLSGFNFFILIVALIIIPTGGFHGAGTRTAAGYRHTPPEAAVGLIPLTIATFLCCGFAWLNFRKPMPVFLGAIIDFMLASVFFPMAIYAVSIGFPSENWCAYWGSHCQDVVKAEKGLVVIGAVFCFFLSFIHFTLLCVRCSKITDDRSWKRPSNTKFSFLQFDFDLNISKRTARHTCTCCAQLAASRHTGESSAVASAPTPSSREIRVLDV
ncbi:hypothetical protein VTL71DRAFT_2799 [Oculimacula yallundae]|uniref:MARVEL domain-containing protein n=1 Tax=Oculimacula yallundae TaxID=86028 RepID=A0ABR4C9W0_9HELO